jgi:hypothetical protein
MASFTIDIHYAVRVFLFELIAFWANLIFILVNKESYKTKVIKLKKAVWQYLCLFYINWLILSDLYDLYDLNRLGF